MDTIQEILSNPAAWQGRTVCFTGWCLRADELSVFVENLNELVSWVSVLGARFKPNVGIPIVLQADMEIALKPASVYLGDLWTHDLKHKWLGTPILTKFEVQGQIIYCPIAPGHIIVGRYESVVFKAQSVNPMFDGIIDWSNFLHYGTAFPVCSTCKTA